MSERHDEHKDWLSVAEAATYLGCEPAYGLPLDETRKTNLLQSRAGRERDSSAATWMPLYANRPEVWKHRQ